MTHRDTLIQVVKQLDDLLDWINFMLTSASNYHLIYPEFIRTKFYLMTINFTTLPPCRPVNDRRFIEIFDDRSSKKSEMHHIKYNSFIGPALYVTTDRTIINLHSQIFRSVVYQIYGLFLQGLKIDYSRGPRVAGNLLSRLVSKQMSVPGHPYINYDQMYDTLTRNYDNDLTTEEFTTICNYPHIKSIDAYQSLEMSLNYVRNNYASCVEENEQIIYRSFSNIIKSYYSQQIYCRIPFMLPERHMTCVFCKETIHNDEELSSTDKHQYIQNDGHGNSYLYLVIPGKPLC